MTKEIGLEMSFSAWNVEKSCSLKFQVKLFKILISLISDIKNRSTST